MEADEIKTADDVIKFAQERNIETYPLDAAGVAQAMGIRVRHVTRGYCGLSYSLGNVVAALFRDEDNQWIIEAKRSVNDTEAVNFRWNVAYELGHYVLHRHLQNKFLEEPCIFHGAGISVAGDDVSTSPAAWDFAYYLIPERDYYKGEGIPEFDRWWIPKKGEV
jgi:hypothetical protein